MTSFNELLAWLTANLLLNHLCADDAEIVRRAWYDGVIDDRQEVELTTVFFPYL